VLQRARALAVDVSPLRESVAFRALWGGQVVSLVGTHMRLVAVPFQVFAITKSSAAVGLLGLAEVVPLILFSIAGGTLADSIDRRRIMAVAQVLLAADSAVLAALTLAGRPSLPWIYGLVAGAGALAAVDQPARTAMIPSLVSSEQIPAAMALRQVVFQTTHIAGPALGGLLIAALGGVGWLYVIDAATFAAALVTLRWVPPAKPRPSRARPAEPRPQSPRPAEPRAPGAIREGLSYAFRTPLISSILVIDLVAMIFGMPRAVFPALAEETFRAGAFGLGLLYAAPAGGALASALITGWVNRIRRSGIAVLIAVAVWGAAITLAGLSLFSFPLTLAWLAVAGAADVVSAVFRGTMLIEAAPDRLLGRVNALNLMVVAGGPRLGDVEAGVVAELVGAGPSVVIGGLASLLGTAGVAAGFRSLRVYRSKRDGAAGTRPAEDGVPRRLA
jgi:MFS family permease